MTSQVAWNFRLAGMLGAAAVAAVAGCSSGAGAGATGASGTAGASGTTSSSSSSSATGASSTGQASSSSTAASAASATSTGTPTSGAAASAPRCTTSDLSVTVAGDGAAAGSAGYTLIFANTSPAACSLDGYPGVSLTAGSVAAQVGAAARRQSSTPYPLVTIAPGVKAYALLIVGNALNYPAATCSPTPATALRVYPPDETQSVLVPLKLTGCRSTSVVLPTIDAIRTTVVGH